MAPAHELIKQPEGKTLEIKRDLSSPRNLLKTLVAFANTAGGILLVGIDNDSREALGIGQPLDEEERLCNLIADNIEPRLVPEVELIDYQEKTLLAVEVYPSSSRPHWLKSEGVMNGVYVRLGSTNRKADNPLINELRRTAEGIAYDELPLPELSVDDLDLATARQLFKNRHILDQRELQTLKIVVHSQGKLVPTIGGFLLFGRNRAERFADAWIQCGRFMGMDKSKIFDHTEIVDYLPVAVERAIEFIKKHAMRGADLSGTYRQDVWNIPLTMVREAVINAVVHADYSQIGAPLRIAIFDDRLEIENPGILLPGLTVEDILNGVSKLRNKVIGRVFRELGLIEQWGSGIRRMFREAERLGLPEPAFLEIGMRVRFVIFLSKPKRLTDNPTLTGEVAREVTGDVTAEVTGDVARLLSVLTGEMKRSDIQKILQLKHDEHFREAYLQPALLAGLIEMTIPDKPRSSKQRYRLTEKGRLYKTRSAD